MKAWHLKNETLCPSRKKGKKRRFENPFLKHEKIPDKCVVVNNKEPLGVWDRAGQKSLKDCKCLPTVACKQRHAINILACTTSSRIDHVLYAGIQR